MSTFLKTDTGMCVDFGSLVLMGSGEGQVSS